MDKGRIEERLGGMEVEGSYKETKGTVVAIAAEGSGFD